MANICGAFLLLTLLARAHGASVGAPSNVPASVSTSSKPAVTKSSVAMPATGAVPSTGNTSAVAITTTLDNVTTTTSGNISTTTLPPMTTIRSVCFHVIGCFDNYPPFDNAGYDLPMSPDEIGSKFYLFTRHNSQNKTGHVLDYRDNSTFRDFHFDHAKPLKIIVHGFSQDGFVDWVMKMKDGCLKLGDFNVITVDWKKGAEFPNYDQAVANTRVVASQIRAILTILVAGGLDLKDVHMIGHSLGAHTSGYTGFLTGGKVGRISGMDPAEPSYEHKLEVVRLDKTDAMFVDVIHTNGAPLLMGGAGLMQESGHVDFFVNGGEHQPGCKDGISSAFSSLFSGKSVGEAVSCSHGRSHQLYIESMSAPCPFTAYPCTSYDDFNNGQCLTCGKAGCSQLGYYANQYDARGDLYLKTAAAKPFCGFHYTVEIKTSLSKSTTGILSLQLTGKWGKTKFIPVTGDDSIPAGSVVKKLFMSPEVVGDLTSLQFKYIKHSGFFWGGGEAAIKVQWVKLTSGENGYSYLFCFGGKSVAHNTAVTAQITQENSCP